MLAEGAYIRRRELAVHVRIQFVPPGVTRHAVPPAASEARFRARPAAPAKAATLRYPPESQASPIFPGTTFLPPRTKAEFRGTARAVLRGSAAPSRGPPARSIRSRDSTG